MKISQIINELIRHGNKDTVEGKNIIVIGKDMWIYDRHTHNRTKEDIEKVIGKSLFTLSYDNIVSVGIVDFVYGAIENNHLKVDTGSFSTPTSLLNTQVKKIVKELNLDGYSVTDFVSLDGENYRNIPNTLSREDVLKSIDDTEFYHGTSSTNLESILKLGLFKKDKGETNFDKLVHENLIFITTKQNKAIAHANGTASKDGGVPVILELKLPDKSKLVLDYDVAVKYYGLDHGLVKAIGYDIVAKKYFDGKDVIFPQDYSNKEHNEWQQLADKSSLNTKIGSFGYSGRIPASHINSIITDKGSIESLVNTGKKNAKQSLGRYSVEELKQIFKGKGNEN